MFKAARVRKKALSLLPLLLALASCTGTPVAVVFDGHALKGNGVVSPDHREFSFTVSDETISCSSNYVMALEVSVTAPITCSNGKRGKIDALRFSERRAVGFLPPRAYDVEYVLGKISFTGGGHGVFIMGDEAKGVTPTSLIVTEFDERWDLILKNFHAQKTSSTREPTDK